MSNNLTLDVLVRLRDLLSGPARSIGRALEGIGRTAKAIGLVGAAIAGISFLGPIREAAAFQQQLVDIALTQNLTGQAAFQSVARMTERYQALALDVGQTSDAIGQAAGMMIAAGLDDRIVDGAIGKVGKLATAAHAATADIAQVATTSLQTLKVPVDELDGALAGMMVGGKLGAFEMRDMAKYFPSLTGQVAKFGVTGREAVDTLVAGLQIARMGTSDSAEAANNFKNFLSKILSPETVAKFRKAGVDIQAVMMDAATKGINPVEAVIQKISKLSGASSDEITGLMKKAKAQGLSDKDALDQVREQLEKIHGAGALGSLFGDQQVMDFLIPFLANIDKYKEIKAEVSKATGEMINADFETQMQALNQQLTIFGEIGTQATREVGLAFGKWLPMINDWLSGMLLSYREWNKASGGMGDQLLMWAGGAVIAVAALGALGVVMPILTAGFAAFAALLGPAGLLLAAVGIAGYQIWRHWESVGPALKRMWNAGAEAGQKLLASARAVAGRYGPVIMRGLNAAWSDIRAGLGSLKGAFDEFMKTATQHIDTSGWSIDGATVSAYKAIDVALQGIRAAWGALKDFGSGFGEHINQIGKNIGGTVDAVVRFSQAIGRIASAIGRMVNIDTSKFDGIFKALGRFAGQQWENVSNVISKVANFIADAADALASLIELVERGIDWSKLLPDALVQKWNQLAAAIEAVKKAISGFDLSTGQPWSENGKLSAKPVASPAAPSRGALTSPYAVQVGGQVTIKVDGPGKVTGVNSTNPAVPVTANTGRMLGRA